LAARLKVTLINPPLVVKRASRLVVQDSALDLVGSVAGEKFPVPIAQIPETIRKEQWRRAMDFFNGGCK
jgi:hypothetical protein